MRSGDKKDEILHDDQGRPYDKEELYNVCDAGSKDHGDDDDGDSNGDQAGSVDEGGEGNGDDDSEAMDQSINASSETLELKHRVPNTNYAQESKASNEIWSHPLKSTFRLAWKMRNMKLPFPRSRFGQRLSLGYKPLVAMEAPSQHSILGITSSSLLSSAKIFYMLRQISAYFPPVSRQFSACFTGDEIKKEENMNKKKKKEEKNIDSVAKRCRIRAGCRAWKTIKAPNGNGISTWPASASAVKPFGQLLPTQNPYRLQKPLQRHMHNIQEGSSFRRISHLLGRQKQSSIRLGVE
ncbi:hypothetical protein ABVK25_006331 [Lepraria finkii]|uniref:Uncharacterized protein n=1 Tax=Lepraria finkii TaxID=1340010 RepID=A0ABR4B650_9LECA